MRRFLFRASVAGALLNAAWRWLTDRQIPLCVDGRIVTWAHGDAWRDDTAYLQKALDRGGQLLPLPSNYRRGSIRRVGR